MWEQIKLALTRKTKLARPIQLIIFITDRCNARCVHCFNWRALNQGDDGLKLGELQRLSGELGQLLTLGISGGEPFLRQDIATIYSLFSDNNRLREIDIPTNGLLPEHVYAQVQDMLTQNDSPFIAISLSLEGLAALHDRIRDVPGNFASVQETYHALVALKNEYPHRPLLIKVATTLCNWNIRQIPDLIAWVQREMPAVDFHNFEIMRGEPMDVQIGPPTVDDLEWVKPYIFQTWDKYAFYGRRNPVQSWLALRIKRFVFTMYIEILRQKKQLIPCYAARTSAVVDAKGNVYFCELRESIGNLREASLQDLWHSEQAECIRASIERGDCYCVHSCFQQKSVFLNPRLWPHILLYVLTGEFTLPPASHIRPLPLGSGDVLNDSAGQATATASLEETSA